MQISRSALRYAGVTAIAYVLFLLSFAPASLLLRLPGVAAQVQLENPTGTLWSGRLDRLRVPTPYGEAVISNVQWQWQWRSLLQGEIAFQLESADAVGSLTVSQGWHGARLQHFDLSLPAAELSRMLPTLGLLQPGGEVRIAGQDVKLSPMPTGKAELFWNNASLNMTPVQPLGHYQLRWHGTAQGGRIDVQTLQGKLYVEGSGELSAAQHWRFQGSAQTEPQHAAQLRPLLEKIGTPNADGSYRILLSGS